MNVNWMRIGHIYWIKNWTKFKNKIKLDIGSVISPDPRNGSPSQADAEPICYRLMGEGEGEGRWAPSPQWWPMLGDRGADRSAVAIGPHNFNFYVLDHVFWGDILSYFRREKIKIQRDLYALHCIWGVKNDLKINVISINNIVNKCILLMGCRWYKMCFLFEFKYMV